MDERISPKTAAAVLLVGWLAVASTGAAPDAGRGALPSDVTDAVNLLANPSFEEGSDACPVDWVFANQCQQTAGHWVRGQARSGEQCVSVEGGGGLAYGRWMTAYRLPLDAGRRFRVGFWYKGRGGSVYLLGNEYRLGAASGIVTENMGRAYQAVVAKPEPSDEWRFYTGEFAAPGYPSAARLCLAGGGQDTCFFDEVTLLPEGLHLVQPRAPILCETGGAVTVEVRLEGAAVAETDPVEWTLGTPGLSLTRAVRDPARGTWRLELRAGADAGVMDLVITCREGKREHRLSRPHFIRVHEPLQGTFAFVAFTDAHLYRPGANERNGMFGRFVAAATALDPLFALGLGDQMEISSGATDTQKKIIAEAVREQLGRLPVPVFPVAGNHEIDKTAEGAGTRWYHEKYLGYPPWQGLEAGPFFFAGIDTTVAGLYGRDHGGGLVHPGEATWLADTLRDAHGRGLSLVLWSHMSPYGEFADGPDRNRLLGLICSNDVRLVLSGHIHDNLSMATPNPCRAGAATPPWPKPELLPDGAAALARLGSPGATVFFTTTTVSAFLLGGSRYNGFLYAWVRDGKIAWLDVLPLSLSLNVDRVGGEVQVIHIRNGPEKAIRGLPLRLGAEVVRVEANGREIPFLAASGTGTGSRWIQVDVPAGGEVTVSVNRQGVK